MGILTNWCTKVSITEPLDAKTFPNLTDLAFNFRLLESLVSISASNLVFPRIEVGSAALSVETLTKFVAPQYFAAFKTFRVP